MNQIYICRQLVVNVDYVLWVKSHLYQFFNNFPHKIAIVDFVEKTEFEKQITVFVKN